MKKATKIVLIAAVVMLVALIFTISIVTKVNNGSKDTNDSNSDVPNVTDTNAESETNTGSSDNESSDTEVDGDTDTNTETDTETDKETDTETDKESDKPTDTSTSGTDTSTSTETDEGTDTNTDGDTDTNTDTDTITDTDAPDAECEHEEEIIPAKAPSCTEEGLTEGKKCSKCGDILVEQQTIPLEAHQESEWITEFEAVCGDDGYMYKECTKCGAILEEKIIPATGAHTEGDWVVKKYPTCKTTGKRIKSCTLCGSILVTEEIPMLGHDFQISTTRPATCTKEGYIEYKCARRDCNTYKQEILEPTGHDFGDDNVCDICGYEYDSHGHSYKVTKVEPTCTGMGYTLYVCDCGHQYKTDYIDQTGHRWDDGVVTTPKTCKEDGEKTYTCSNCGETYVVAIPASHNWKESVIKAPTCKENGAVLRECQDCGAKETEVLLASHTWDEGVVTEEPACEKTGTKLCTCTVCGETKEFEIKELGHHFVDGVCTRCGAKIPDVVTPDDEHLEYGMYFKVDDIISAYGPDYINEYGVLLNYNEGANIEKVAVYLTQDGTMWRRCIACVGTGITYATYVPYLSYDENIKYTGLNSAWINTFSLRENKDGIWCYSDYATIGVNLEDKNGNLLLSLYDIGQAGSKTRVFDDLDEMIAWLGEDSESSFDVELDSQTNTYTITSFGNSSEPDVVIPSTYKGVPVTKIADEAFLDCTWLTSITLPDSITTIGKDAFSGCTSLQSITIPSGVTNIGANAFKNCSGLTQINFNATAMDDFAQSNAPFVNIGATADVTVNIGKNVTKIPAHLINSANVTSIVFEDDSVCKSIGEWAFQSTSITSIVIPDSVETIGNSSFDNCTSLKTLTIGKGVKHIEDDAFSTTGALTDIYFNATAMEDLEEWNCVFALAGREGTGIIVRFGENVTRIPAHLFDPGTTYDLDPKIIAVYIPASVMEIGEGAIVSKVDCKIYCECEFEDKPEEWNASWPIDSVVWGASCMHENTEILEAKTATEDEYGLTEGLKCSDCDEILVKQSTIDINGNIIIEENDSNTDPPSVDIEVGSGGLLGGATGVDSETTLPGVDIDFGSLFGEEASGEEIVPSDESTDPKAAEIEADLGNLLGQEP